MPQLIKKKIKIHKGTIYFKFWLGVILIITSSSNIYLGQQIDSVSKQTKISFLPVMGYTPETSVALGGVLPIIINPKPDSANFNRPSIIQPVLVLTFKKQFIFLTDAEVYLKNNINFKVNIEAMKFPNKYSGIGNNTSTFTEHLFDSKHFLFKPSLLKAFKGVYFAGIILNYNTHQISSPDTSLLTIEKPLGYLGGSGFGLGPKFKIDTRDDVFYPIKGAYIELISFKFFSPTKDNMNYVNIYLRMSKYFNYKEKNVFAISFTTGNNFGNVPFYNFEQIGGANNIRGLFNTRFTDKFAYFSQYEYRRHLYKRFKATAFVAFGQVSNKFLDYNINDTKIGYGVGIRFQLTKTEKLNLRFDYAFASNQSRGFYISVAEAF